MKTVSILKLIIPLMGIFISCDGQIKNAKIVTMNISGNCEMCKEVIENTGMKKNVSEIKWDVDTKMAVLKYDSSKTTSDKILKEIALAGYDNEKYLAPDDSYNSLPSCCHYNRKMSSSKDIKSKVSNDTPETKEQIIATSVNPINILLDKYMDLKDALIKGEASDVSSKAKMFANEMQNVMDNGLNERQKNIYSKYSKSIAMSLIEIANAKNLKLQRERFGEMSAQMYELAKTQDNKGFYYQHCPMFNNGKNSNWLSYDKTIKNPFYGMEMLSCGKTIESLNIK